MLVAAPLVGQLWDSWSLSKCFASNHLWWMPLIFCIKSADKTVWCFTLQENKGLFSRIFRQFLCSYRVEACQKSGSLLFMPVGKCQWLTPLQTSILEFHRTVNSDTADTLCSHSTTVLYSNLLNNFWLCATKFKIDKTYFQLQEHACFLLSKQCWVDRGRLRRWHRRNLCAVPNTKWAPLKMLPFGL